jgi:hypothetical protein
MTLKLLSSLITLILLASSSWADISKLKMDGRLRYFTTLVDDLGTNVNSARPGTVLDLHFTYPISENIFLKSINFIHDAEDSTSGDETYNLEFNQRLALFFKLNNMYLAPYGKMVNHDNNPDKQADNAHLGVYAEYFFKKNISVSTDYREETSNGAVLAGTRYGQQILDTRYKHRNMFQIGDMQTSFYMGYVEGKNLRGTKHIKLTTDVTKNFEISAKVVKNIGKGPIFSNNIAQNRSFTVIEFGYKF